jgi:O-methyltransferase
MPVVTMNDRRSGAKPPFVLQTEKKWHGDIIEADFWELAEMVWGCTMCRIPPLYNLYSSLRYIFDNRIDGHLVECGVYLGGCVMLMEEMCLRYDYSKTRKIFAFDTFAGFAGSDKGVDIVLATGTPMGAKRWPDFSAASIGNMQHVGFDRLRVIKGNVLDTVPQTDIDRIALLRLDTDTYETTRCELEHFHGRVVPGGVTIIDDYGFSLGCKKAVDEYIAHRRIFPQRFSRFGRSWVKTL